MKHLITSVLLVWLVVGLSGCFSNPSLKNDPDLDALIEELVKHNIEVQEKRAETLNKGVTTLTVATGDLVTANLSQASIPTVVNRILTEADTPYVLEDVSLHGTVTARFTEVPLVEALNRIVQAIGLVAVEDNGLVVIKNSTGDTGDGSVVYREVAIKNLSQAAVTDLLEGIYPQDMDNQRLVNFGFVPSSNSVYLYGAPDNVTRASQLLVKADRTPDHVSIEVLVVEFNREDIEEFDTMVNQVLNGEYTLGMNVDFPGEIIFNWAESVVSNGEGTGGAEFKVTNVKGVVEMLISDQKARLISRPYISTLSGTTAQIQIVNERYVEVGEDGESTNVTSGVTLQITPTVLGDGNIRMDVSVEDSQFSPVNVEGVLTEVNKNAAQTIMHIGDGQTIIVGGLVLNRRSWANSGFPFLRNIPVVNLLTSQLSRENSEKEIAIYITPRIWEPNMLTPLIGPDALTIQDEGSLFRK